MRTPDSGSNSQSGVVSAQISKNGPSLKDRLYTLLSRQTHYAPFSNTGYQGPLRNGNYDSLESLHNQIHALVGGHMGSVNFAGFDPIFW